MSTIDSEKSAANILIQIIRNVTISRYFTAAGLVVVLYDIILTIEDEVSRPRAQAHKLYSFSAGSPGLARAFRNLEATLLHQPVLGDCVLDDCQFPWVTRTADARLRS